MHCRLDSYPDTDPFYSLVRLLKRCPKARVVLVHGGDVRLLEYAELVRHNSNLLLDLSLTMMKYAGSSIDADIGFLFRRFDRRICVGTDFPEYSHSALRGRFDHFSSGVAQDKLENIGFRNLQGFLAA
jgi:predicted TIM-barrel fold metal-dependent hydrolase